jgi:phosphodiester glycosidase
VQILRSAEVPRRRKLENALQCGPLLVDGGTPVRGLDHARSARRTFAVVLHGDKAAIGAANALTLADLADALPIVLKNFRVWRALNLDGGSSTAFWFRRDGQDPLSIPEEKSVRDFVAVVAR